MYDTNQIETIATGQHLLHSLFLSLASPPTHPGLILSPKFFFSSAAEERRDVLIGTMWRDGAVKGGRSSPQYHVKLNSPTERQSKGRHPTILPQIPPSTLQQNITLGIAKDRSESWKITNILPENWFHEIFLISNGVDNKQGISPVNEYSNHNAVTIWHIEAYLNFASVSQFFCNVFSRHSARTMWSMFWHFKTLKRDWYVSRWLGFRVDNWHPWPVLAPKAEH